MLVRWSRRVVTIAPQPSPSPYPPWGGVENFPFRPPPPPPHCLMSGFLASQPPPCALPRMRSEGRLWGGCLVAPSPQPLPPCPTLHEEGGQWRGRRLTTLPPPKSTLVCWMKWKRREEEQRLWGACLDHPMVRESENLYRRIEIKRHQICILYVHKQTYLGEIRYSKKVQYFLVKYYLNFIHHFMLLSFNLTWYFNFFWVFYIIFLFFIIIDSFCQDSLIL